MTSKAKVEWWKEALSPQDTIAVWSTAAASSAVIAVMMEERMAEEGLTMDQLLEMVDKEKEADGG